MIHSHYKINCFTENKIAAQRERTGYILPIILCAELHPFQSLQKQYSMFGSCVWVGFQKSFLRAGTQYP